MRAQMKMTEQIIIMMIFFFLLVFGVLFYTRYSVEKAKTGMSEKAELVSVQAVQKAQFFPGIQCTVEGTTDYNCLDLHKLDALSSLSPEKKYILETMFPRTTIADHQVFTVHDNCEVYDVASGGKNTEFFAVPVALFDATTNKYSMGYMNITVKT